jgi:putative lipase involved disintegration of autophagic bodies
MRNFIFAAAVALTAFSGFTLAAQKSAPAVDSKSTVKAQPLAQIWKSETTKHEYRVRVENNVLYAEWINPPPFAAKLGVYVRTECRRLGTKWIGTSRILYACAKEGEVEPKRACPMTMRFELDSISPERITGRAETPNSNDIDCEKCQVRQTHWGAFVWVPKR